MRLDAVAAMIYKNFGKEEDGDAIMAGKAGGEGGQSESAEIMSNLLVDLMGYCGLWLN